MKKAALLAGLPVLFLVGCGNGIVPEIEGYEWVMMSVQNMEDGQVLACSEEQSASFEEAEQVELVCTAEDGALTLADRTNDQTYTGTYQLSEKDPEGVVYEITVNGYEGLGITAMTEYLGDSEDPTLVMNLEGYTMYFLAD